MRFQRIQSCLGLVFILSAATNIDAAALKIATIAPDGTQWMQSMRTAASDIKERTEGRVVIKYYAGGVMGGDRKVMRKIRIGQLQGGVFTANGLAERYRDIVIYGLPMIFQSQEEVDYVRERIDPVLSEGLEEAGFVSFGFAGGGFAMLMGSQPVTRLEDLRGRKVWAPEGDRISYEAMRAMDLAPVVLPVTDVLTALQTGLLEFIATPPIGAVALQWYTKVKYVTAFPFAYTLGLLVIDKRAFSRLEASDQEIVREVMTQVYKDFETRNKENNQQAEEALAANGLQFVSLQADLITQWQEVVARANEKMGEEGLFSSELLAEVLSYLEEYRNGNGQTQVSVSEPE